VIVPVMIIGVWLRVGEGSVPVSVSVAVKVGVRVGVGVDVVFTSGASESAMNPIQ